MDETDPLQMKIAEARAQLPAETRRAIDSVPWKIVILEMRNTKGYTFEQLGDLETETELVLAGILSPEDYPRELESRMHIPKQEASDLVREMNDKVFKKIREALIKNTEEQRAAAKRIEKPSIVSTLPRMTSTAKEESKVEEKKIETKVAQPKTPLVSKPARDGELSLEAQKILGSFKVAPVKTEHTLNNLTKTKELPSGTDAPELPASNVLDMPPVPKPKIVSEIKPMPVTTPTPKILEMKLESVTAPVAKAAIEVPKVVAVKKPSPYLSSKDPYRLNPDE